VSSQPQPAADDQVRHEIVELATRIANANTLELTRVELGPNLSFERGRTLFEKVTQLFALLKTADLQLLSEPKLLELKQFCQGMQSALQDIRNFKPQDFSNPFSVRDSRLQPIAQLFDRCFDFIGPILAYTNIHQVERWESTASQIVEKLNTSTSQQVERIKASQEAALKDLAETLKVTKDAAQQVGIVRHANFFEDEAKTHNRSAHLWLGLTALLAGATIYLGWLNYHNTAQLLTKPTLTTAQAQTPESPSPALEVQFAIAKLIIFSILFSAVIWAGKIYRAHRHNAVINRHRRNALSTFETFAKATDDQQIKNAVLLQATTCIFGPQATGYIAQEKDSEGYPQILEIVRSIASPSKKDG
jgi:hypothetical protein